jgi:hypothetical protein
VIFFIEDNGWPILISGLVLVVVWPYVAQHVYAVANKFTSPPPVHADPSSVARVRG